MSRAKKIAKLNDQLRRFQGNGKVIFTRSVVTLPETVKAELLHKIATFDDFSEDNDPYNEHDFISVELHGVTYFAKIDYYDRKMEFGSPDPSNPAVTTRVLTIMRADEY